MYNASTPSKFVSFPKYKKFIADEKYAEIAAFLGLPAKTTEEGSTEPYKCGYRPYERS